MIVDRGPSEFLKAILLAAGRASDEAINGRYHPLGAKEAA